MMAGLPLEIGLTAENGGNVIPTPWCLIGTIQQGAAVIGDIQDSPSKPVGGDVEDDEIIYDGGGFDEGTSDSKDETIYEGGGV